MFEPNLDTERPFDHDGSMHRTYVRRRRTIATLGAAAVAVLMSPLAATAMRPAGPVATVPHRTFVVQPGDTLWSIAREVRPAADPRETIAWIQDVNGVDAGVVQIGQSLTVPTA
jgi:Tfp pilus assembly protein FimV